MTGKFCFLSIFLCLFILIITGSINVGDVSAAVPPDISARTAAVIDVETGQILYDKHMHVKSFPASITKVLTTIVAIEEGNLGDVVEVSRKAAYQEGSSIYLKEGEKIRLEELLYGVMLASGNDASVAVAEHISGSVEEFATLMNKKAKQMGARNSNFVNPNGLPDPNHYTTAYDFVLIMRYALKNRVFREITKTKNKTISWSGNEWGRGLRNHNKLLWSYDDITGGKTGYTRTAGRCLTASAKRDGREVAAVVLNDPDDWMDIRKLLDYGLDNYKKVKVIEKGEIVYNLPWEDSKEEEVGLLAGDSIYMLVPRGSQVKIKKEVYLKPELELPILKGNIIGKLIVLNDREIVGEINLVSSNNLNYNSLFLRFWNWLTDTVSSDSKKDS